MDASKAIHICTYALLWTHEFESAIYSLLQGVASSLLYKNLVKQDREQCNAMQWKRSKYTRKMRYRKNFSFSYDIQTYEYISQHIITYACIPSAECISHSYSWSLMQSHIVSVSLEIWSQHAGARYPSYARSTPEICSSSRKRISRYLLAVTIVCNCIQDWCALCILFWRIRFEFSEGTNLHKRLTVFE